MQDEKQEENELFDESDKEKEAEGVTANPVATPDAETPAAAIDLYGLEPMSEEVSEDKVLQLQEEARYYQKLSEEMSKIPFFERSEYYLVSKKWLTRWKVYTSYKETITGQPPAKYFGCGKLPVLNEDLVDPKAKFTITFEGAMDYLNVRVLPEKQEGADFIFATKDMWRIFEKYDKIAVRRLVVDTLDGPKVEIHLLKLNVFPMSISTLKDIEHERVHKMMENNFQVSRYCRLQEVVDLCKSVWGKMIVNSPGAYHMYPPILAEGKPVKMWRLSDETEKTILMNTLQMGCKSNPTFGYKLFLGSAELMDTKKEIREFDLIDKSYLIAEMKQSKENWMFFTSKNSLEGSCSYCKENHELTFLCSCKYAAYCTKKCKQDDKIHHKYRCPNEAESQTEEVELVLISKSKRGLVGLRNLGNTCFMNSGLQCLSHISALKDYFLSGKYVHEINKENPLGTKGELSTNYAKLIRALWYGEEACFSPTQLKKAIGIYQPMFSGYSQHDSGELVNYLLDGLHEDLNRVKQKPLVETKDYDGRADEVIAKEAWDGFTKRNQSVIVDLMYGQYKSKLDCPNPNCKHQSIQFDPFLVCSLPIKNNNAKNLELTVVVNHVFSKKVTVCYEVQWNWTMKEVAVELCKMLGFEEQTKILFYVASYSSCEAIEYARTAQFVRKEYEYRTIYARELMPEENPADDIRIMLANVSKHNYSYDDQSYRKNVLPYRLYFIPKNFTNKQVHHRINEYYAPFSKINDYEQQVIAVDKKDQPLRLLMIPTSRYATCEFCGKKNCDGCVLKYSDELFINTVDSFLRMDKKIQMELFWRKGEKDLEKAVDECRSVFDQINKKDGINRQAAASGSNLYECFKLFEEPQELNQENAWYCPKCKQFVLAKKQMHIYKAPKVLVLCLKRFKRKGEYYQEKFNIFVDFPVEGLDISPFVLSKGLPEDYFKEDVIEHNGLQGGKIMYDLIGISNHFGSTAGGHYTAYCKDPEGGEWYDFDDSFVSKLGSPDRVVTENAYILFYQRRETV